MRIVVDTNVLISGLVSAIGPPAVVLDRWIEGAVQVAVSPPIITEYFGVLLRPKFDGIGSASVRKETLERLIGLSNTVVVVPDVRIARISEDPSDNRFLECAKAVRADFIVSGDEHLLNLSVFEGTPIVSPRQFMELMDKRNSQDPEES